MERIGASIWHMLRLGTYCADNLANIEASQEDPLLCVQDKKLYGS